MQEYTHIYIYIYIYIYKTNCVTTLLSFFGKKIIELMVWKTAQLNQWREESLITQN